jgi:hypothetical protein
MEKTFFVGLPIARGVRIYTPLPEDIEMQVYHIPLSKSVVKIGSETGHSP